MGAVTPTVTPRSPPPATAGSTPATAGFTLVEILVVIVILAIAAGVAVVAYDGDDRERAAREARRFAAALEHAALRAQVRAETLGVAAEGNVWRFWRRDPATGQWQPVTGDDVLAARTLPASMRLTAVTYGGQPLDANAIVPLRPTGRNEPYAFRLDAPDAQLLVAADPLNRVVLMPPP